MSSIPIETDGGILLFGEKADLAERTCRQKDATPLRYVESNRVTVTCVLPQSARFPALTALHCPQATGRERLCLVTQESSRLTPGAALELKTQVSFALTQKYGRATEHKHGVETWRSQEVVIDLAVSDAGSEVTLLYATPEGVAALLKPAPDFPSSVAGLRFGANEAETQRACESAGGTYIDTAAMRTAAPNSAAPTIGCAGPRSNLPIDVDSAFSLLCAGKACELGFVTKDSGPLVGQTLSSKYGTPITTSGPGKCAGTATRYAWFWGALGKVTSMIRVVDDCGVTVFYDNRAGVELRDEEADRRQEGL